VECGTRSNPCWCKVVEPTLRFVAFGAGAVVDWPVGALVYCFKHMKGRKIMAHPAILVHLKVTKILRDHKILDTIFGHTHKMIKGRQ